MATMVSTNTVFCDLLYCRSKAGAQLSHFFTTTEMGTFMCNYTKYCEYVQLLVVLSLLGKRAGKMCVHYHLFFSVIIV